MEQPPLVGELLAGLIIGPSMLALVLPNPDLQVLSNLAVFFLMFLAGLQMDAREIRRAGKSALVISIIAFFIPLMSGMFTSLLFGLTTIQSLFMGLLLSITAVPVSAMVLMQFGILNSRLGNTVITAAVVSTSDNYNSHITYCTRHRAPLSNRYLLLWVSRLQGDDRPAEL